MAALLWLCLTCVALISGQDIAPEIAESLLALMTEERTLRGQLEAEVNALETELMSLRTDINNVTCGCPVAAGPVAFSAVLTNTIATFGKLQPIIFDKVNVNVGNGYDVRHGTFVAPFDGTYEFTFAGLTAGGKSLAIELVLDGVSMASTRTGDNAYYTMGTNVIALNMRKGQEVWIRHKDESDSNYIRGDSYTSFSGYLIEG